MVTGLFFEVLDPQTNEVMKCEAKLLAPMRELLSRLESKEYKLLYTRGWESEWLRLWNGRRHTSTDVSWGLVECAREYGFIAGEWPKPSEHHITIEMTLTKAGREVLARNS